ncbi:exodeoxyribonuclease III, putative [Entamoeba invadens IP1]|uniref:exodeoxyribonuclease III, putative n=1 Tax=Entamoeba invadens IP1 TaxID=370355 RepID=UPI0002C3D426|nr:exodeoxyribonuclease III, putative [Entamoeba invadens IP1]ELP93334.1 exodeoxyribonuclease III, putative [Entamoeba invadens IP1]|eukprot:XP_004260105.1 exodeoxyribonuclease III, putative [Entamoeba invadens IP1]
MKRRVCVCQSTLKTTRKSILEDKLFDKEKDNDAYWTTHNYTKYKDEFKGNDPEKKENEYKIMSYNVNGINASIKKGLIDFINTEKADIVCLQETKLQHKNRVEMPEYKHHYYNYSTNKKGYSGTAVLSKIKPINVTYTLNEKTHNDGRIITVEFDNFYLVNTYVQNSGRKLENLEKRAKEWDVDLKSHIHRLSLSKKVIWCGDMNVVLRWSDLAKPKEWLRCCGFTKEERKGTSDILECANLIDPFVSLYPHKVAFYTFFPYVDIKKLSGMRADYFFVSKECENCVTKYYKRDVKYSEFVICELLCIVTH